MAEGLVSAMLLRICSPTSGVPELSEAWAASDSERSENVVDRNVLALVPVMTSSLCTPKVRRNAGGVEPTRRECFGMAKRLVPAMQPVRFQLYACCVLRNVHSHKHAASAAYSIDAAEFA